MSDSRIILRDRYELGDQIARGGQGEVYKAWDTSLHIDVAVKRTYIDDPCAHEMLENEGKLLAGLSHHSLPQVLEFFIDGNSAYLVMRFIPGDDLRDVVRKHQGPLSADLVFLWAYQLLDILEHLHTEEPAIIHRDIKPKNIKLNKDNKLVLLDFGISKRMTSERTPFVGLGYLYYAPLEQLRDKGTDQRSDLYSLAATLYFLLTGKDPIDAITRDNAIHHGRSDPLRPVNELNPEVPERVARVLTQAMSLLPDLRPTGAAVMRRALRNAAQLSGLVRRYLIDGSNVCLSYQNTPSLATLLAILNELSRRGETYLCVFDANFGYVLNEAGQSSDAHTYQELIKGYPDFFCKIPGGSVADEYLLKLADSSGDDIISNDRFRDYENKYPWVISRKERLIKGYILGKILVIPPLGIDILLDKDSNYLYQQLKNVLLPAKPDDSRAVIEVEKEATQAVEQHSGGRLKESASHKPQQRRRIEIPLGIQENRNKPSTAPSQPPTEMPGKLKADPVLSRETDSSVLLERYEQKSAASKQVGEIVRGTIISCSEKYIFIDIGYKKEGVVPREEFADRSGNLTVKPGDEVDVVIKSLETQDSYAILSRAAAIIVRSWEKLCRAHQNHETITGRVTERIKGGLKIDIEGIAAFLPGSQVDVRPVGNLESLVNQDLRVHVIKLNRKRGNVVVSRTAVLEEEAAHKKSEILARIKEGIILEGVVKNITSYGAFIDLGGIDGLLHISDMSWNDTQSPDDIISVGDTIQVKVLKFDLGKERISLGYKQLMPKPVQKTKQPDKQVDIGVTEPPIIGIDLGTTKAMLAVWANGKPILIAEENGSSAMPSVVGFTKDGKKLIGGMAIRQAISNPQNTIYSIKRLMGCGFNEVSKEIKLPPYNILQSGKDVKVSAGGKDWSPPEVSALILQKLKQRAEVYLGQKVTQAVITLPACFSNLQRQAVMQASKLAGLEIKRILDDPVAAALAYGLHKKKHERIAVISFGGGAFGISILEIHEGMIEVKCTNGDTHLGGDDIDQRIINWIIEEFWKDQSIDISQDQVALQRMKEAAEKAKIELSSTVEREINLPFIAMDKSGFKHLVMKLRRAKFELLIEPILQRAIGICRVALADAGLKADQIDRVVLVGGSTRIPKIQEMIKEFFGQNPYKGVNPDEIVATGAAIQSGVLSGKVKDLLLLNVTPLSLGVETERGWNRINLIKRNTTIPAQNSKVISTTTDNQTSVEVRVLEGGDWPSLPARTLGRFFLTGIQPKPRGVPQIEISMSVDINYSITVSARDLDSGKEKQLTITSNPNMNFEAPQTQNKRHQS